VTTGWPQIGRCTRALLLCSLVAPAAVHADPTNQPEGAPPQTAAPTPTAAGNAKEIRPKMGRLLIFSGSLVSDGRDLQKEADGSFRRLADDGAPAAAGQKADERRVDDAPPPDKRPPAP
jgi:hypothetical protein